MVKKILFIEDESALQKTLGDLLSQRGYKVMAALDGESGLNLARKEIPDLVLLDLILPRLHGFEVLKRLKENEKTKGIPVVVLTNLENMEDVERALSLGAVTYLVKANYTIEEVLAKVKIALGE